MMIYNYLPKYLLNKISNLWGVDIVKVFSLNALSTFVRMLAGMISVKVVALIIGPAGIALLGQLNNFSSILLGMANGGISAGITKYVAEYRHCERKATKYISNAFRITILCSSIVAVSLILFCTKLSRLILLSDEYFYVFVIFGITIFFFTINNLLIAILNGYKDFKLFVRVNIIGTILSLVYSIALVYFWELPGALINAVTFQSVMLFVTLWMCRKMPWMKKSYFSEKLNKPIVKKYFGYSLMALTTLALAPVCQMLLRGYVIIELSAADAGIWEGMNRISSMFQSIITSAMAIYYLPRMSELSDISEMRHEILRCYKFLVPMLLCVSVGIYFFRHIILLVLFTPEFYSMDKLFGWQLAGDFFRMSCWLLSYLMLAKAKTKMFITTEVVINLSYLFLSYSFVQINGLVGLTQGYLINEILYLLTMIFLFRNILLIKAK